MLYEVITVIDMLITVIDLGHCYGHRAVQIDCLMPQHTFLVQFAKAEDDLLGVV